MLTQITYPDQKKHGQKYLFLRGYEHSRFQRRNYTHPLWMYPTTWSSTKNFTNSPLLSCNKIPTQIRTATYEAFALHRHIVARTHVRAREELTIPRLQVSTFRKYPVRSDSLSHPPSPARRASAQPKPAMAAGGAAEEKETQNGRRRRVRRWRRVGELQRAAAVAMVAICGYRRWGSSHAFSTGRNREMT